MHSSLVMRLDLIDTLQFLVETDFEKPLLQAQQLENKLKLKFNRGFDQQH